MTLSTTSGAGILRPELVTDLLVKPLLNSAVSTQVSTIIQTESHDVRIPILESDPTAAYTAEAAEIAISDPVIGELLVTPPALKGLVVVSNEMVADSDPSALEVVGDGLTRDIRDKLDATFFGGAGVGVAPDGIESLAGVAETTTAFDGSMDCVAEAISLAEQAGAALGELSLVASPADVLALGVAKTDSADSNQSLLAPDASSPTRRSVLGVPLFSSRFVSEGTAWLIPKTRTFVVIRMPATVVFDSSAYFSSDRTAVRAVMRVSPAFPHPEAIVKIFIDGSS